MLLRESPPTGRSRVWAWFWARSTPARRPGATPPAAAEDGRDKHRRIRLDGRTRSTAAAEPDQQEQGLGSAVETGCRSTLVASGRPRRILVAALGTGMGTTTIAALLGSVLATTRAGTVRALDATPHAGRLAARLLPPPASEHDGLAARLEVRTVDPAAGCARQSRRQATT